MRKFLVLFLLTFFVSSLTFAAQTEEIKHEDIKKTVKNDDFSKTTGNSYYVVDCTDWGFFSDRDGNHKPYRNNSNYYTTICSDEAGKGVTVEFQQFRIEKFDRLYVWDEYRTGPVAKGKDIAKKDDKNAGIDYRGSYNRYASPGKITSAKGCLTFQFVSDDSVVETGWYAKIGCASKPSSDPCKKFNSYVAGNIKCGVPIKADNYSGNSVYSEYGNCHMPGWESTGRELIYKFVNYKASDLTITLKEHNDGQPKRLNMFILNNCSPSACIDSLLRPAQNMAQGIESVKIPNAAAGTYYIVVDGNTKYAHNWFTLSVECTGGDKSTCKDPYYYEDFESFKDGDYIGLHSPYWSAGQGVGIRDGRVSTDRSSNGTKSLEINRADEGTQDVYVELGRKFKGVYRICWNMYIEKHHTAFFGLFGGDNSDPWGSISKEFEHHSDLQGRWFDVELFVDLDKNKYVLYMDNRCRVSSGDYYLNLYSLNFYGLPKAHFYVDHICYGPVKRIPPAGSISKQVALGDTPLYDADVQLTYAGNATSIATDDATNLQVAPAIKADDLKVIPNPTAGSTLIALDMEQEQNVTLQIFSPAGQIVRNFALGKTQFIRQEVDLSDLSNGLYILKATGEQSVVTKKIILQK